MALIVVIEDEHDLLDLLEYHLQKEGYQTFGAVTVRPVEKLLEEERPDLMVVDRNLPGVEGSEFVRRIRSEGIHIPVIFLSAKSSDREIEEGFLRGGDDYLTKPFNIRELLLRVKALLRRSGAGDGRISYRDLVVDRARREVWVERRKITLTKREFDLLVTLLANRDRVLSREELIDRVWHDETEVQGRTVNVTVTRLKEKIDPDKTKHYIQSVRGVGYRMC